MGIFGWLAILPLAMDCSHDLKDLVCRDTEGRIVSRTPLVRIVGEPFRVSSADHFVPSPTDSRLIAFTRAVRGTRLFDRRFREPNHALYLYDSRTGRARRLTPGNLLALDPSWSPDGRAICFRGYYDRDRHDDPFRPYRIGADGRNLTEISTPPGGCQ